MNGTDANTGKALSGIEHVYQSLRDILTTPKGSRVMRRYYGSDLFSLVDKPMNLSTKMDIMAATADAIERWETRIQLTQVNVSVTSDGAVTLD